MKRRKFLKASALLLAGVTTTTIIGHKAMAFDLFGKKSEKKKKTFPVSKTEQEWKKELTPEEFRVLRKEGTERSGSSPLNNEKRAGVFTCAGCGHRLYATAHKFESGTGWPSFYQPIKDGAVGESTDYVLLYPRTELHCANCGGHLGHSFNDGPEPTGLRHCINGVALDFIPETEMTKPSP